MTAKNLYNLAADGKLGRSMFFEGYCLSAAIDACFSERDLPLAVYQANKAAVSIGEIGQEGEATDEFYQLLGSLVFKNGRHEDFKALAYYFTNIDELQADLSELRGNATILLDVNDGHHSVGLKPVGENANEWKIVGTHQLVAVSFDDGTSLDVQGIYEPETLTTEQVWQYLRDNNSPDTQQQTGLVFPSEPLRN